MDKNELFEMFTTRYLTRKEIMYRLPSEIKIIDFWPEILKYRKNNGQEISLLDQQGKSFWFCEIPYEGLLNIIDAYAKSSVTDYINKLGNNLNKHKHVSTLILDALVDEAFNSSVIEGAFSTRKRSKEIIQKNIIPTNVSEQMILNNYKALEYILENLHQPITEKVFGDVYKIITENTLDDEDKVEKYRNDSVIVWDYTNQKQIYEGPHFSEVPKMMDNFFKFINNQEDNLHPIVKASIIHFYMVYIHPFFDGNGRTARAISYMYLLQNGYDFFKFFSISTVIKEHKNKYYKAILDTEENNNDLTYFIDFNVNMILTSLGNVLKRIGKEFGKVILLKNLEDSGILLTKRQKKCIEFFIKKEKNYTTIDEYKKKHKVAYETARKDLNTLESIGILNKMKKGKKYFYKFIGLEKLGMGEFALTKEINYSSRNRQT